MILIQKKVVVDEHGVPQEVIIPWAQFCELSEAMGLDLDEEAMGDLRAAREDLAKCDMAALTPLSEIERMPKLYRPGSFHSLRSRS